MAETKESKRLTENLPSGIFLMRSNTDRFPGGGHGGRVPDTPFPPVIQFSALSGGCCHVHEEINAHFSRAITVGFKSLDVSYRHFYAGLSAIPMQMQLGKGRAQGASEVDYD
jgi:hypothetical protein